MNILGMCYEDFIDTKERKGTFIVIYKGDINFVL